MFLSALGVLLNLIEWLIILDVILSIISTMGYAVNLYRQIDKIVAPLLEPFRKLQNSFNLNLPVDLSPILALLTLDLIQSFFRWVF